MVSGPASRPWPASSLRIKTISSTVSALMAFGEVFGRRDRGSNAASPSARYRATSRDTQPWETPYAAGYLALRPAFSDNSSDDKTCLRHPPTVPASPFRCLETRRNGSTRS